MALKDPYQYFRIEAQELLAQMTQGVLDLEKKGPGTTSMSQLLRWAHTLKGAARVVKQAEISKLSHEFEEILAPFRELDASTPPFSRKISEKLLNLLDNMSGLLKKLTPAESTGSPSDSESIRLAISDLDTLFESASEAITIIEDIKGDIKANAKIERLERQLHHLKENIGEYRLLPASLVFPHLQRTVRDTADQLQKKAEFIGEGGELGLDSHVLSAIRPALIQIVRNSVAHGIESETVRTSLNKPRAGMVRLRVERRNNQVAFVCEDDGAGINLEAIREAALERGILSSLEREAFNLQNAIEYLTHGGLSTAASPSEVSGRGVGLNLVWETLKNLRGEISIHSEPGKGVRLELCVPNSLESIRVLHASTRGIIYALPLDTVRHTVRLEDQDIIQSAEGESIFSHHRMIRLLDLARISVDSQHSQSSNSPHYNKLNKTGIIVDVNSEPVALKFDELKGVSHVTVKLLPRLAGFCPWIAGAFLDAFGNPHFVLNPQELISFLSLQAVEGWVKSPTVKKPSILVVDDSLTSRMLEQSILESAGYHVETASSAEDALKQIQKSHFGLFIVDVEMPGMNGFEFIERMRADPRYSKIPSILVTSRVFAEDRARGEKAGARAHIAKNEFNESGFLQTIRTLIG